MAEIYDLVKKFHLHAKTHKTKEADTEDWVSLVLQEKYWDDILVLYSNNALIKDFFNSKSDEEREKYLNFGIACFTYFVQSNFTGPTIPKSIDEFLAQDKFKSFDFASRLAMNGEDINVNTKNPALLAVSEFIFDCCIVNTLVNLWWCCRALMIHQDVLDELSPSLLSNADRLHKLLQEQPLKGVVKAELSTELAQMYLKFRHITKAQDHITTACDVLGLEFDFVGKLGKRTKYQTDELAQLTVKVTLTDHEEMKRPEIDDITIPQNFSLNDDVRLDQVRFSEESDSTKLPNAEQKLILTIIRKKLISSPSDELQTEEILPFIEMILNQKNTYTVRVMALLLRCKLESNNKRTIERCLKQCEDIINNFKKENPPASNRVGDVFGTSMLPIWKVQAEYADILLNFGLVKNSLDVYLNIQLWEEVIICYNILKMREKAAEVIRQQLEVKPTVKLMCLLGDATDDITCYETAWEMSKKRSHRAQRHWGRFLFARKKYEECIPHFEKSLSINPLQANIWLGLGFAALQVENWQTAATAYRRYTTLEPDGFEAWNNLAQAYIKLGNNRSAHQAILEALKCNFDNWKVWENLLLVSCDISNYSDIIRAYHRIIDLKEKYLNVEALNILVYSVCNDATDCEGNSARKLLQKIRELLGRVAGLYPNSGPVWELYASLAPVLLLRAQRLQRAYRGYTQGSWDKDPKTCLYVLNVCRKLGDVVLEEEIDPANTIINSVKLNLNAAIAAIKKQNWEETKEFLEEVSNQLEQIVEKMKKAKVAVKIDELVDDSDNST
ncbi:tetratricopeptide repeat protein 27 [Tribolium madens]|uniref:tetratricopeptide repeat protein 27 n=1 Tax=Tribolium madens TaxID=41895 RepID=UPI001CF73EFE|nr:tetratricopeptide repeat protein 27 [Tribolium madens]